MIYFIRDTASGHVKIGVSSDPEKRFAAIQTANPGEIQLLSIIEGDQRSERALHLTFDAYRAKGEWFRMEGALAAYIESQPPYLPALRQRKAHLQLMARLSKATGRSEATCRAWLDRNRVPAQYWLAISEAGIVTLEDLARRHADPDALVWAVA